MHKNRRERLEKTVEPVSVVRILIGAVSPYSCPPSLHPCHLQRIGYIHD